MPANGTEQRKLAAIMFTDMVGYTALSRHNEAVALELLEEHRALLRSLFPRFGGREIKTIGDAFLVEFASALEAARCAIEIQRALSQRNLSAPTERQVQVRIGIHVGDIVHRQGDVLGDGVNIASRIEPLAEPGGICISVDVARQIQHNLEATVVRVGEAELKNVEVPFEICRIVLPWERAARPNLNSETRQKRRLRTFLPARIAWAGGLLVVGAVLVVSLVHWFKWARGQTAPLAQSPEMSAKSVAVLPFLNLSADKADEYLSDGMTEELLNVLAKVPGLRVPGRSSSFAFKGKNEEDIFRKVGEQLHVIAVLEGSVRRAGSQLRITAQLINVADGFHLWSDTFDRDMTNIFVVQTEVAQQVAAALKLQLGMADAQRLHARPTENLAAYELYLKGRFCLYQYGEQSSGQAIEYFNQAIALDPAFAKAYAGLAGTYAFMSSMYLSPREAMPLAKSHVLKALELDPTLAEAHHSYATIKWWGDWDFPGAQREFDRALELNPNEAVVYGDYADFLANLGRFDEALQKAQKAVQLSPFDGPLHVAWAYHYMRRYDLAAEWAQRALKHDPNSAVAHQSLAEVYLAQARFEEAISESKRALELAGDHGWSLAHLAISLARGGKKEEARKYLEEIDRLRTEKYVSPVRIAELYEALGERENAIRFLRTAYEERCDHLLLMKVDPGFDTLRPDRRFVDLLKNLGLEQ